MFAGAFRLNGGGWLTPGTQRPVPMCRRGCAKRTYWKELWLWKAAAGGQPVMHWLHF